MTDDQPTDFKPAFYARTLMQALSLQQMDKLLANGYYRNGLDACASSVRFMGRSWVSAVMLRVRLTDFVWKKRLRKLLRNNGEVFSFKFQPFSPTAEKEAIWQQFKSGVHGWQTIPTLEAHLLRGQPASSFNTWELLVYDGAKLAAFSIFDRGEESICSLEAAYDTAYRKYSPGLYTMLLEIEFCLEEGLAFYYPGFYPKGVPMFSYKLRPGYLEFFRVETAEWLPFEQIANSDWILDEILEKQTVLIQAIQDAGFSASPGYNHCYYVPSEKPKLHGNSLHLLVSVEMDNGGYLLLFVSWNLLKKGYQVFEGRSISPPLKQYTTGNFKPHHFFGVQQANYFGIFKTPAEVVIFMQKINEWVISPA